MISQLHLVPRRKRKRANHASLMLEPGMLMAVAITTFSDVLGMSPWLGTLHRAVRMRGAPPHTIPQPFTKD